MSFQANFVWGVASAAYQIEGGATEDGRGASIWDTFSHTKGKTFDGNTGDVAADAYHRYQEDIDLMASCGIEHYRFSISWSRIDPRGDGIYNEKGFSYYDKVIDACLAKGIEPYVTLYHWDLPQALEDQGGWLSRDTATAFANYAHAVAAHFKSRVKTYITLNEPECSYALGYATGEHAPGKKLPPAQVFACLCNLLLAHGLAMRAVRSADPTAQVGIATTGRLCYPATENDATIAAARKASFAIENDDWMFTHHMVLDPVCFGRFPACDGTFLQALTEAVSPADLEIMHAVPDFMALNIYNGSEIALGANGEPVYVPKYDGFPRTALKWPVTPDVMHYGVRFLSERYSLPIFISENGQSCNDRVFLDGNVHDPDRIDFLHRYLLALKKAAESGADVRGYFHWCWTDNYEWNNGYKERFGLVFVDYRTQKRIPKDSAAWYAQTARTNGEML